MLFIALSFTDLKVSVDLIWFISDLRILLGLLAFNEIKIYCFFLRTYLNTLWST